MIIKRGSRTGGLALAALLLAAACSNAGTTASPTTGTEPSAAASSGAPSSTSSGMSPSGSAASAPTVPSDNITLQGAGATFPATLYQQWFQEYNAKYSNIQIDYQANGSGAGIKAITQQTVDFGASDAAMKDSEISALPAGTKILHFPTALGAVVMVFNLPGVSSLQLDGQNVADIYLGTIKTWNDPKIAANNPGVTLPSTGIFVVHRADSSGTTNTFTSYLDAISPDWHSKVGAGKDVKWPTGTGGQGNDGVAGAVKQTPGAIGYVELSYSAKANLPSAKLKNADGQYVAATTDGVTAAANAVADQFPPDFRQAPIINGKGASTYPVATYTYLLVYVDQKDATKAKALVAFIYWALTDGQQEEASLGYAPLPQAIQQRAIDQLHQITSGGSPVWPT